MIEPIHPDRWIEHYAPLVFRTCRRNTSNEDSAWDAFQETFLAYTRRRDDLDLDSDHAPWLHETARRCCLAVVRKERRLPTTGLTGLDAMAPSVDDDQVDSIFLEEAATVLREEIDRMSDEDQNLLGWLYAEGMTHRQIADRLNCPDGSVHARAEQVRNRLRQRMKRRGIAVGVLLLLFLLQGNAEAAHPKTAVALRTLNRPRSLSWQVLTILTLTLLGTTIYADFQWYDVTTGKSEIINDHIDSAGATGCGCHESAETKSDTLTVTRPEP